MFAIAYAYRAIAVSCTPVPVKSATVISSIFSLPSSGLIIIFPKSLKIESFLIKLFFMAWFNSPKIVVWSWLSGT